MPVTTQTKVPSQFVAGDTVIFSLGDAAYPATLWYCDFILSRNGTNLATIRATADGNDYLVTLTGSTSNVAPGPAAWFLAFTEISSGQREFADAGILSVIYNPAATLTPTANQTLLAACNAALLQLTTTANAKVDFNGQMFERHRIGDLMAIRDRIQALVWDELRAMGIPQPGGAKRIQNRF